jgi:DNA-binding ferritin-like protein (Dps family)
MLEKYIPEHRGREIIVSDFSNFIDKVFSDIAKNKFRKKFKNGIKRQTKKGE